MTAAGLSLTIHSVYSNTLMTSLNSRAKLGGRGSEYSGGSTTIGFRHVDTNGNTMDTNFTSHGPVAVNIMKGDSTTMDPGRSPDDKLPRVVCTDFWSSLSELMFSASQNWDVEMNDIDVHPTGRDGTSFIAV